MIPIRFGRAAVFLACFQGPPAPVGPELAGFGRRYNATGTGACRGPLRDVQGSRRAMTMSPHLDNLMMDHPLTLTHFFERSRRLWAKKTVATRVHGLPLIRYDYPELTDTTTRL